jgi:hypothetical protein
MTRTKNLKDRVVKISISLDRELLKYLDELDETRSEIIRKAIVEYRIKHRYTTYARIVRDEFLKRIDRSIIKHTERD